MTFLVCGDLPERKQKTLGSKSQMEKAPNSSNSKYTINEMLLHLEN